MRILNVLPGMTGLLQINDRNTDDFDTWFKYDLEYILFGKGQSFDCISLTVLKYFFAIFTPFFKFIKF